MPLLSIVVLNYNRLNYTKRTIKKLIGETTIRHEFILVDNGSTDGTREYLTSLKQPGKTKAVRTLCVFNDFNFGVAGGRNSGLLVARGDYVVTIDNDILVPDTWDKHIQHVCEKVPRVGMTGVSVEKKDYAIVPINNFKMQLKKGNLNGGCLAWRRDVINKLGFFDNTYQYGLDDLDMYLRVKRMGLISAYIVPKGIHIDKRENKEYENIKKQAHLPDADTVKTNALNYYKYKRTKNVYVPYSIPWHLKHNNDIEKALKK